MEWLIEIIQCFPVAVRVIVYVLLTVWAIKMFLLPFNVARLVNRLGEIKKLLEKNNSDSKAQMETLGSKFDIANLVMSDFWKYKQEHDGSKRPSSAIVVEVKEEREPDA